METVSETLNSVLREKPPGLLYHYTSPTGLIGIARSREVWATNVRYFNDPKEIGHAVDVARRVINGLIRGNDLDDEMVAFLEEAYEKAGAAARRYYVFALSEKRDLLSQWRAYCPPSGGYSIGFPSSHLQAVCKPQAFFLAKCVYDPDTQWRIVGEIVSAFMERFGERRREGDDVEEVIRETTWELYQYLAQYGTVIKHPAFREEAEWRLISEKIYEEHERIEFRAGDFSVVPYYRFMLETDQHPDCTKSGDDRLVVVVGPTRDSAAAQGAVQFLNTRYWGASHSSTAIPYRAG